MNNLSIKLNVLHCLGIDAQLHTNCHFLAIVGFSSLHGFSIVLINDIFIQEFFCQNNSWFETQVNHLVSGIRKLSNNRIGDSETRRASTIFMLSGAF